MEKVNRARRRVSGRARRRGLAGAHEQIERLDLSGAGQAALDIAGELRRTLERIAEVRAGEVRVLLRGANGSMKSTLIRLLLGVRPSTLRVGPGAVTGAVTELRLVAAGSGDAGSPVVVRVLTESAARRRAQRLLGLAADDPRTLAELAGEQHANAWLVRAMLDATRYLEYGAEYTLDDFTARGGVIALDGGAGPGTTPLVERVRQVVEVAPDWDLSWAGERALVLVDTPGERTGGQLEDVIVGEMAERVHIAVLTAALGPGTKLTPATAPSGAQQVIVLTKLDKVENPTNRNELTALEQNVEQLLAAARRSGNQVRLAAISGPAAFADLAAWLEFDPANRAAWDDAVRQRPEWEHAWDGSTGPETELQNAVESALHDGGVLRLRRLIAGLADADLGHVDEEEVARLFARARELTRQLTTELQVRDVHDRPRLQALWAEAEDDPAPVTELRRLAKEIATEHVYGAPEWDEARGSYRDRGGRVWTASVDDVRAVLGKVEFAELAADAIADARDEYADAMTGWRDRYLRRAGLSATGAPVVSWPDESPDDADEQAAAHFAELAARLLALLRGTSGSPEGTGERRMPFRPVARAREEITRLLERRIVALLADEPARVRRGVVDRIMKERNTVDLAGPGQSLSELLQSLTDAERAGVR